jgi:hypothetical protein
MVLNMLKIKILSIFLSIIIVFIPFLSFSESQILYLKKGQVSPFEGTLLNKEASAKILSDNEFQKEKCKLEQKYIKDTIEAELNLEKKINSLNLELTNKKFNSILDIKDKELDKISLIAIKQSEKNNDNMLWLSGGLISGILTTVSLFFVFNKIEKNK